MVRRRKKRTIEGEVNLGQPINVFKAYAYKGSNLPQKQ